MSTAPVRVATPTPSRAPRPGWLLRFDCIERAAHWANALLFTILMATALPLYFASIERFVGRRALVVQIHLWAGLALPIPLLISLAGPWGTRLRADLRRINVWTAEEVRWLATLGRQRLSRADKFNPGQKLNSIFVAGAGLVMLGTGAMLKWFEPFSIPTRTGATFVHDVLATVIFVVVIGHVLFALTHPTAMRSMLTGRVPCTWAAQHATAWADEEELDAHSSATPGAPDEPAGQRPEPSPLSR